MSWVTFWLHGNKLERIAVKLHRETRGRILVALDLMIPPGQARHRLVEELLAAPANIIEKSRMNTFLIPMKATTVGPSEVLLVRMIQ